MALRVRPVSLGDPTPASPPPTGAQNWAYLGSSTSHGGTITTGAARADVGGFAVARVTDVHNCPIHGINAITTGSPKYICEGQLVAVVGSLCACGAHITTGIAQTLSPVG